MRRLAAIALAAALAAPAAASGGDPAQEPTDHAEAQADLRAAQKHWNAQHLRNYQFRLAVSCFCPDAGKKVTITVRNGKPRGATNSLYKAYDTIPEQFAAIRSAANDDDAGPVRVTYSSRRGYPRDASLDRLRLAIDDEVSWVVTHFKVLSAKPRR